MGEGGGAVALKLANVPMHDDLTSTLFTDIGQMWDWTEISDPSIHCWRSFYYTLIGKQPFMSVPVSELLIPLKLNDVLNVILKAHNV